MFGAQNEPCMADLLGSFIARVNFVNPTTSTKELVH